MTTRGIWVTGLAALLIGPGMAQAATRHATPDSVTASGSCAVTAPCTLAFAVSGASAGDTVSLAPGTYTVAADLAASVADLTIEGASTTPVLSLGATVVVTNFAPRMTLRNLRIQGSNAGAALVSVNSGFSGTVLDRVTVAQGADALAVAGRGLTIRNSVVTNTSTAPAIVIANGAITGSTVIARGAAPAISVSTSYVAAGGVGAVTVRNTIARGGGTEDLEVSDTHNGGGDNRAVSMDIGFSAYGAGRVFLNGPDATVIGDGAAGNNVATTPVLVDLAGATDLRQLGGSPTIDAGSAAVAAGAADIEGDPRVIGTAPDIGADEYVPAPAASTGAATAVTATTATVGASVTPNGRATTYRIEYGTTTAYGSTTAAASLGAGTTAAAVSTALTGLTPSTTYHYRVVATNSTGTTNGADAVLTTAAAPDRTAPVVGPLRITPPVRATRRLVVAFTLSEDARAVLTVSRPVPGRVRGGACRAGAGTGRPCTAWTRVARIAAARTAGPRSLAVPGPRLARPGAYRLELVATDAAGNTSTTRRKAITLRR